MSDIEILISDFCRENGLSIKLSGHMPVGYETAYGTYDITVNTLFLNFTLLKDAPKYETLFYLFHELRHAMQYSFPSVFDEQIQESRFYVVLYNGICFKLTDNQWRSCTLDGSADYFTRAYLSLPYELDANVFAYERVKAICGDTVELRALYARWMPHDRLDYGELKKLFCLVEDALRGKG